MNVTPTGMLKSLWLFLFLFVAFQATASHIVGGEVTYQCLGNNSYRVIVTKFRDCSGVIMQPTTNLSIHRGNGSWDTLLFIPKGPSSFINVSKPGCGVPTPNICIETARYILDSIHLPPSIFGYTLYNQGCCRNYNVNNILDAWKVGSTFPSQIVGTGGGCNNSPVFNKYPPVAFPANVPLAVDVSATDPDSDSLSYDLCSPLDDDNATPPFVNVPFAPGYSAANLVPSSPPLTINRSTGLISGTITSVGKYTVGICITEWRNGMIVGTVRRDYQFTVIQPWAVFGSVGAQSDATCATINNGSATIVAGGGQAPYSFAWSGGGSGPTRTNLAPGTYSVTITDNLGCKDVVTVVIGASPGFTATVSSQTDAGCGNAGGGSATIAVSGGAPPYTVTWPDASTGFTHNNLSAGSHAVVVSDATNCPDTIVVNIGAVVSTLAATAVVSNEFCAGSFTGEIDVTVTSGNAPFSFLWNDAVTTEDRTGLTAGNYWVAITDNGGCTDTLQFTVGAGNGITAVFDLIGDVNCAGDDNGFLSANATNARGPLKYLWSNNSALSSISGLSPGTYWVVITDSVGCSDSIATTIKSPDSLEINLSQLKHVSCNGFSDGSIAVTAHGGKAPYTYAWSNASTSASINKLPAASYTLIVTDANGCSVSSVFNVKEPAPLQISLKSISHETCNGSNGAISVAINGGTRPYAISWNNALTDSTIQNLGSGAYTINVTDSNGCTASASYTINPASPLNLNIDSIATATCGLNNGFASILASGGVSPYSIVWSNAQTGLYAANLAAGTIQAVVTDSVGCTDSISIVVPNSAGMLVNVDSISAPSCAGLSDGFASISSSGGVAPLTIKWSNSANLTSTNSLPSGAAYVVVIDAQGCKDSISFSVPAVHPLQITLDSLINLSCNGALNGKIKITPGGGTPPYSYSWTNGDTTSTLNKLGSGSYGVTVTDARACSISATYNISEPDSLQLSLKSLTDVTCFGGNNGQIALSIKGGTKPYSILWNNSQTDSTAINLVAGNYSVTITDASGCSKTGAYTIVEPGAFALTLDTVISASCGQVNGSATVMLTGGSGTSTVRWSNGQTGLSVNNLAAGNYTAIATDSLGCTDTLLVNISNAGSLLAVLDSNAAPGCVGGSDGFASASATGGTAPYSYLWSTADTTSSISNLPSGQAWVVVSDSRGCSDSITFTVASADTLQITLDSLINLSCNGALDGKIKITPGGGTPPYSYSWTNGDTTSTLNKLGSGSYGVTVTDARACSISATYNISEPDSLQLSLKSLTDVTCFGGNNGQIALSIKGGTKPYSILWNNSQTDSTATNLIAGNYSVTITDASGCSVSASYIITEPTQLTLTLDSVSTASCGQNNGAARVSVTGGTPPYTYKWNSGSTADSATSLGSGVYSVVVTDALGCADSLLLTIPNAANLSVALDSSENISCYGGADGYLAVTPLGGVPPYTYNWSNGDTLSAIANLHAGNYSVTITDNRGCSISASYKLTQNDSLRISLKNLVNAGCDTANGQIAIGVKGGTKPYTILWNNSQTDSTISNLTNGNYSVTVTDANGCSDSATYTITAPPGLSLQLDTVVSAKCGAPVGRATLSVVGGVAPFTVNWSNAQTGLSATNLMAGTYTVNVVDSNGCTDSLTVVVANAGGFTASLDSISAPFCGALNGYGFVSVTGASGQVNYLWSNGDTTAVTSALPSGPGFVLISDSIGCTDSIAFTLASSDSLKITVDTLQNVNCYNAFDGKISISLTGGTPPYSYSWTNGDTISTLNKLGSGSYGVTVTDARACSISATYNITEPNSLQVSLKSITNISCTGLNDGEIAVSVKGGTAPYSLLWSNAQTDSTAKLLFAGTHILYVTDAAGCRITDTFHISQPDTLSFGIDSLVPASCGKANGYVKFIGVGGTPPYIFEWNTGQLSPEEDSLMAQLYTVKITDANGCIYSEHITIPAVSPLSVQLDTVIAPLCVGDANGAATITATGGTAPYSYRWMGGDSTSTVQNLTSGITYVIVTDARGCTDSLSIMVPVKDSLLITADTVGNPNCYAAADGFINLSVTGGNAPYSYSWSNADTSKNRANLTAGSYTLTVTDNKGCTATATYILTQPDSLQLSLKSLRDVSCNSSADGELSITIAGGTKPYSIAWSNAQTDSTITALVAATYVATITDANGCSVLDSFNVQQPAALGISLNSTTMAGCGLANGTAGISASGGSGSYSISWDNGERGWAADSLSAGAHLVVVVDSNGCADSIIVNVQAAPPLVATVDSIKSPTCSGGGDAYSAISVSGGVPPYSYLWNNNVNQPNNYNLQSGRASVVVTDALGCKDSVSVLVPQTDSIRISLDSIHHVLCYGDPSAYLEIAVDGGTKPYAINWNNNSRGKVLQNGAAGIYSVTVTDSNGCMNTALFEVTEPDTFYIIVDSIKNVTCDGSDDGAVFMRASNGHVISSIQANRGKVGSSNVSQLAAGRYSFWIENTNGCGTTVEFEIKNPQPIKVTEYRNVSPGCDDESNGIVELRADGGNGAPYFFVWDDGVTNPDRYDLPAGKHSVMVTDVKGCSTTKNIYVAPKKLAMDYRLDEVGCSEQADARLVVHAAGATLPFTLYMNGEKVYQNQKIMAGNYTLTLVDADSCATSKNVIVEPNKGANLFFATAFTPNNDGLNDTYEIKGSDECLSNARLEIFTRWGGKVFSTDRPFEVFWDGTVNGQPAKVDIYMYNFISDEKQVTGYLNVLK